MLATHVRAAGTPSTDVHSRVERILKETPKSLRWWKPLLPLDALVSRLPGVRYLAWNMVMWGTKPVSEATDEA